ncbi:unnamed protein product [Parnassius mnemosyne]|uniref:Major facilitator superfamily (MFS) profile domain-containing protein n=2 Tax=Parnassius mnemosyne TaxID=213953 RepID=A0AAV1KSM1_9NEOP
MVLINNLIGNFGKYHLWLSIIILLNKFGVGLHQMAIIFLAPPVHYTCPNTNITCCYNPVYDKSVFSRTIITEWNLICENSWLKDFTQTLFQFGVLIGSLVLGAASDRYGRRPTLISAVIIESLTGVIASFLPDFWSFTIVRMMLGFSIGGILVIGFVIIMEYVGSKYRDILSALFHVPFSIGHISLAAFGYYITDYMYFQLAISVINIILLFYICVLPESPRWLLATNKTVKAISLMKRVAKINNLPLEDIPRLTELYQLEHKSVMKKGSLLDLFRTPNIRRNIIIMAFLWLVCSYCFYGVAQYISHLTGNIYVNVVASGSVSLCSCFVSIPLMKISKRKTLVIVFNVASSICLIVITFVPEGTYSVVLGCCGVFFTFIVFIVLYLYCSEMFPTVVRNAAIGISSMMARVGSMIAPFVAGLRPHGQWCAPVAFGVFPIIGAILCFMLPETKDCELLMTIEEGEALGRNQENQQQNIPSQNV